MVLQMMSLAMHVIEQGDVSGQAPFGDGGLAGSHREAALAHSLERARPAATADGPALCRGLGSLERLTPACTASTEPAAGLIKVRHPPRSPEG